MFLVDDYGNIELVQGDSGELVVEGLPTDKSYSVYFAIQNENRQIVSETDPIDAGFGSMVTINIPASLTDNLIVPIDEDYGIYYYGIKICNSVTGLEDTLVIDNGDIGDLNTVKVYPKKVEGIE